MASTPPYPSPPRNANTLFRMPDPSFVVTPRLRVALANALERFGRHARAAQFPGYLLVAERAGAAPVTALLPALSDHHVIIGRHTECDLVLASDPSVSLRHVLARMITLEDGTRALRLLDLETSLGFAIESGRATRSLVGVGPFAVAIGSYFLSCLPTAELAASQRPGRPEVPIVSGGGPYRELAPPVVRDALRVPESFVGSERQSHITLLPGVSYPGFDPPSSSAVACLTITSRRGTATAHLDAEQLERGVLIGRAEKCFATTRHVLTESVSRAHALVLRSDGEDRLYDLASTQHTFRNRREVRSVVLPRSGLRLRLGVRDAVELVWSPRFDA